ncbi:putative homeobox domain-containing protein [Golovinomyces cichoracearum]|uniref:Putative homeobox domain-containing protein n=1 Tax=Golovinomyces cichoracearum TaxID=62708 RepID=A0A420HJG8_9PEZI|nr:putative homeobox domain-containing protein [Golovinomyces cichoracearum]
MTELYTNKLYDMSHEGAFIKMTSIPSPTSLNPSCNNSISRRPLRKSTLTQQQKNQKRQRATQDQLVTLEMEFNKNPTPNATVRERIAEDINMTERSVQIWFQNRRAKIKLLAKKSIETGEDCDSIPDSMRNYLAMHPIDSGKSVGGTFYDRGLVPYGNNALMTGNDQGPQGKVVIHHLSCRSLSIGSWRRVGQNAMDLIIFYSPDKRTMTYYINNDQAGYKIEYPFSYIKNVYLENGDLEMGKSGGLVVELTRSPIFFMDSSGSGGFFQCGDFTEDQQASQVMVHHLGGHPKVLSGQLAKLVSLEPFMSRHDFYDESHFSASAPVSPTGPRPSSQPNFNAQPHVGMYQEGWGVNVNAGQRGPGHKRQRSRSVPTAIDVSMFNNHIPSLFIQHSNGNQTSNNTDIYSPVPQPNILGNLGPNLKIDTSPSYNMDYRQYPVSATTVNSSSDFASPGFFPNGPESAALNGSFSNTPTSVPYLSPTPVVDQYGSIVQSSGSPLSFMTQGDPAIVNQSPPLFMMHRSPSADAYTMSHGYSNMSDDGTGLNEMYSKHTINLPIQSPKFSEHSEMDMNQLVSFDESNSSLSPEAIRQ